MYEIELEHLVQLLFSSSRPHNAVKNVYSSQFFSFARSSFRPVTGDYLDPNHLMRNGRERSICILTSQLKDIYWILPLHPSLEKTSSRLDGDTNVVAKNLREKACHYSRWASVKICLFLVLILILFGLTRSRSPPSTARCQAHDTYCVRCKWLRECPRERNPEPLKRFGYHNGQCHKQWSYLLAESPE
jgi:hypothetical protein